MRVLLTGAGGQLGTDLLLAAPAFPGIDLVGRTHADLDITDAYWGASKLYVACQACAMRDLPPEKALATISEPYQGRVHRRSS